MPGQDYRDTRLVRNRTHTAAAPTVAAVQILAANKRRLSAVIVNNHATVVMYVGNSDVSAANGIPIAPGASFTDNFSNSAWWGIMASAVTGDARMAEVV